MKIWTWILTCLLFSSISGGCMIETNWVDIYNSTCQDYKQNGYCINGVFGSNWVEYAGFHVNGVPLPIWSLSNNDGVSALEACCECQWNGEPVDLSSAFYLDPRGSDSNTCSYSFPCATISNIFDIALNHTVTDLNVMFLPGEYSNLTCNNSLENIYIMNNLNLNGIGKVNINCDLFDFLWVNGDYASVRNVTISKLNIFGSSQNGTSVKLWFVLNVDLISTSFNNINQRVFYLRFIHGNIMVQQSIFENILGDAIIIHISTGNIVLENCVFNNIGCGGLPLQNCNINYGYPAINLIGNAMIYECSFENVFASVAIDIINGNVMVDQCIFENSFLFAIFIPVSTGNVEVKSCSFFNIGCSGLTWENCNGGYPAVLVDGNIVGDQFISNCEFNIIGGPPVAIGDPGVFSIGNIVFRDSTVGYCGQRFYFCSTGFAHISNITFTAPINESSNVFEFLGQYYVIINSIFNSMVILGGLSSYFEISNANILSADFNGIGVLVVSNSTISENNINIYETKTVIIKNCVFIDTYSVDDILTHYGAAITIIDYSPLLNARESSITGEITVNITNCQFIYSNPQVYQTFAYGTADGAILFTLTRDDTFFTIYIVNSSFIENVGLNGGAIYAFNIQNSLIIIENCIFTNNSVYNPYAFHPNDGGAIKFSNFINSTIHIKDSSFTKNVASLGNGGAISIPESDDLTQLIINNCLFDGNFAGDQGGAIFLKRTNSVQVSNSVFINNQSKYFGGSISVKQGKQGSHITTSYNMEGKGLYIKSCKFLSSSSSSGGVIYSLNSLVVLESSSFDGNHAKDDGNCIFMFGPTSLLIDIDNAYSNNDNPTPFGFGGAIFLDQSIAFLSSGSNYSRNSNGYGGAISLSSVSNISISKISCSNNFASILGGCLFIKTTSRIVEIVHLSDGNLFSNVALQLNGGSIYMDGLLILTLSNIKIKSSQSIYGGGVAVGKNSQVLVQDNVEISDNIAQYGGAVSLLFSSSSCLIKGRNIKIESNQAGWGAVFEGSGFVSVSGQVDIVNNIASMPVSFLDQSVSSNEFGFGSLYWFSSQYPPSSRSNDALCNVFLLSDPSNNSQVNIINNLALNGGKGLIFNSLPLVGCSDEDLQIDNLNRFNSFNDATYGRMVTTMINSVKLNNSDTVSIIPGCSSQLDLVALDYFDNTVTDNFQFLMITSISFDSYPWIMMKKLSLSESIIFNDGILSLNITASVQSISTNFGNLTICVGLNCLFEVSIVVYVSPCKMGESLQKYLTIHEIVDNYVCRPDAIQASFSSKLKIAINFVVSFFISLSFFFILFMAWHSREKVYKVKNPIFLIYSLFWLIVTFSGVLYSINISPVDKNCAIEFILLSISLPVQIINGYLSVWRVTKIFGINKKFLTVVITERAIFSRALVSHFAIILIVYILFFISNVQLTNPIKNDVLVYTAPICIPGNVILYIIYACVSFIGSMSIIATSLKLLNYAIMLNINPKYLNQKLAFRLIFSVFFLSISSMIAFVSYFVFEFALIYMNQVILLLILSYSAFVLYLIYAIIFSNNNWLKKKKAKISKNKISDLSLLNHMASKLNVSPKAVSSPRNNMSPKKSTSGIFDDEDDYEIVKPICGSLLKKNYENGSKNWMMQSAVNHKKELPFILTKYKVMIKKCKTMIENLVRDEMEIENLALRSVSLIYFISGDIKVYVDKEKQVIQVKDFGSIQERRKRTGLNFIIDREIKNLKKIGIRKLLETAT